MTNAPATGQPKQFRTAAIAVLIVVGIFAFGAFFVLSAYAPSLRDGNDGGAHGLSQSAVGYLALTDLLERTGTDVILSRSEPFTDAPEALTILTPPTLGKMRFDVPYADERVLIILPKWHTAGAGDREGWVALGPPYGNAEARFDVQDHLIDLTVRRRGDQPFAVAPLIREDDDEAGAADDAGATPREDLPDEAPGTEPGDPVDEAIPDEGEDEGGLEERIEDMIEETGLGGPFVATRKTDPEDIAINPRGFVFGPLLSESVPAPDEIEDVMSLQTVSGEHIEPVWTDGFGRIVLGRVTVHPHAADAGGTDFDAYEPTEIYVLADPDLLNTMGLASAKNAAAAAQLIGTLAGDRPVLFDLTAFGFSRPRNMLTLALEPPFLAASVAGLLTALLLALHATARFGPPERERVGYGLGKAALADNTAVLLSSSGKVGTLGPRYARMVRARIADALGIPRGAAGRIDEVANRILGKDRLPDATLQAENADGAPAVLSAARRLHQTKKGLMP